MSDVTGLANKTAHGSVLGLFYNDALLPAQFAAMHTTRALPPEKVLQLAVLQYAIDDYQHPARDPDGPESAERWLASDSRDWPLAFAAICDSFGWDAATIRTAVLALPRAPMPERAAAREDRRTQRLNRAIAWAEAQCTPWTMLDLRRALGCNDPTAKGIISWLRREGRLELTHLMRGKTTVGYYRVRRAA